MSKDNQSELLKLKNDSDFWECFEKLGCDEASIEEIGYLLYRLIDSKLNDLSDDDKEKIKAGILESKMMKCIRDFEEYFIRLGSEGQIPELSYREWFKNEGIKIIEGHYLNNRVAENDLKHILCDKVIEKALISTRNGNDDFVEIGKDEYGTIYGALQDVPESALFLLGEPALNYIQYLKEKIKDKTQNNNIPLDLVRKERGRINRGRMRTMPGGMNLFMSPGDVLGD